MLRALAVGLLVVLVLRAQLPASAKLSEEDKKGMTEELSRLHTLLESANDECAVEFQIARTYAAGHQYREAMNWLKEVVDSNVGFDPSRDQIFDGLRGTKEFQALTEGVRSQTPPVSSSRPVALISEADLSPENLAYDPAAKAFFLGSTSKDEIVRCNQQETCEPFVSPHRDGLGSVLGLKIHQPSRTLWATSNTDAGASLYHYSLRSGELIRGYPVPGAHLFNDLAISSAGDVFVTDTREGSVYRFSNANGTLQRLVPHRVFTAANGIALSPDEKTLYVAHFGDGISVIDLKSMSVTPVSHPADVCLAYIDGLYALNGSLIAIQNGPILPRIVRFMLKPASRQIVAMAVLERRNPLFDGITTGSLVGGQFYYVANSHLDKAGSGKLDSSRILALRVTGQN